MSDSVVIDVVAGILFSYSLIIFVRCFLKEEMTRRTERAMEERNKKWTSVAIQGRRILCDRMRMLEEPKCGIDDYIQAMEELERKYGQVNQELKKEQEEQDA